MATQNLGRVGLVLKGEWDSTTQYTALDVVSHDGNAWAAKQNSTNVEPTTGNSDFWQLFSNNADLVATVQGLKEDAANSATAAAASAADAEASAQYGEDAFNAIAHTFDPGVDYTAGKYVWYSGELYRFNVAHPAGAWIGTGAAKYTATDEFPLIQQALGTKADAAEVADLKSALTNTEDIIIYAYEFSNDIIHVNISPTVRTWSNASNYDFHYFEKPTNAKLLHIKSNATNGTVYAFLNASDTHTSGNTPSYATGSTRTFIPANTDAYIIIPDDCKYIWITKTLSSGSYEPQYIGFNYDFSHIQSELEEAAEWNNKNEMYFPINVFDGTLTSGVITVSTGRTGTSTAGQITDFIDISAYQKIKYTRVVTTGTSAVWGMTFYDDQKAHISNTGEGPVLNGASYGYTLSEIKIPTGAKYARFTWNNTLPEVFAIYDAEQFNNSLVGDIERLESYHPNYSGKRLSILGDSISTFAASNEKTDGKATEGCTTNYPGNPVQYSNSDVTSVGSTWWGKVLNQFGMVLGINESWAGSTIGYNPNQTSGGKYTADNCLCSATRIGHLGENGTPDIIIVFGGTNDINHHRVSNGSTIRYAVGSLDSEHNPYDFDSFPMVTETYYGSITTMLLRIQHTYPNATILMLLPYFCTYTHTSSGDIATPYDQNEWSNAAIDVCKFLGVEYLDLRTIINLYDVSSLLFDGLHPKANGMAAIAKAVIHKLNNML